MKRRSKDFAILTEYLENTFPEGLVCRICGEKGGWVPDGPYSVNQCADEDLSPLGRWHVSNQVMPVVFLICGNCYHLEAFSWLLIKERVEKNAR